MPRPKLLGISYAVEASLVFESWRRVAAGVAEGEAREARARVKSLATFEARARANPLAAGDPVARDRWPRSLAADYGADLPNLFRFELAGRWRGYYSLVGEPGGARVWVLYLWDHARYDRESGYAKK